MDISEGNSLLVNQNMFCKLENIHSLQEIIFRVSLTISLVMTPFALSSSAVTLRFSEKSYENQSHYFEPYQKNSIAITFYLVPGKKIISFFFLLFLSIW